MAKVVCTLPNVGKHVNGFAFTEDRGEFISEELQDDVALHFASIPGYRLVESKPAADTGKGKGKAAADAS